MNGVTFEWVVVELLASLIPVSVVQLSELLTSLINIIMKCERVIISRPQINMLTAATKN